MMREAQFAKAIGNWTAPLPHARMAVYRNNVISGLVNALNVRFPVTGQLVGHDFFAAMARAFAEMNRPASPVLIGYGGAFPDFIRGFAPAAAVPYLGDVAQLENLWWQAYHAAHSDAAPRQEFASIAPAAWGGLRFKFHSSLGLMRSAFAVASIWQAHHDGPGMAEIAIGTPQSALVCRPERHVTVRVISPAAHDFIAPLQQGARLAEAVEQMAVPHPDFDLALQLQGLMGLGIITGFSQ